MLHGLLILTLGSADILASCLNFDCKPYMQALTATLFPVTQPEEAAVAPQDVFISSGCICALLDAIKAANTSTADGEAPAFP